MAVRAVAAFYAITGNPAVEAEIKSLRLETAANDAGPYAVLTMENFSHVHFRPLGNLILMDSGGKVVEEVQVPPIPVLPRRVQSVPVKFITPIAPGRYILRANLDLGMRAVQRATAEVTVTSAQRMEPPTTPVEIAANQ